MRKILVLAFILMGLCLHAQKFSGYFDLEWDESSGLLTMEIPNDFLGQRFLYVNSLTTGIGSNDIGLDRGKLGKQAVVYFYKSGNKVLLMEDNLEFRADTDNELEALSVKEAFAQSVLHGFTIDQKKSVAGGPVQIILNDFVLADVYGVTTVLSEKKQGEYSFDKTRSAIYKEGIHAFPKNVELESIITVKGKPKGDYIKSVSPNPELVTMRQHHSFIELPDDKYEPREFHPESGFFYTSYMDYASPIGTDMTKRFIMKHRLEKKNPDAEYSEAVEPIVYYLDSGCPEPVRSALLEGARWWNQAFEAAGYKNAFQVEILPADAHPLDVRYNVIQWVHRSTRGWSYGGSIADPRTGEIIKGHVSLGSLRVRQDFMIAQGILSSFDEGKDDPRMLEMALARLRQLSAHEVGHTIGLAHNFAASHNDRASVMDYPHPLIQVLRDDFDFASAYDDKIGEWDKRAVIYGYSSVPKGKRASQYLSELIKQNHDDGFLFITDQDARPQGGVHPYAHLWDNGKDPVDELDRVIDLRKRVLENFDQGAIAAGTPNSELEKVLVPAFLMHRYQVEAAVKLIGGTDFTYSTVGDDRHSIHQSIDIEKQQSALQSILATLSSDFLIIPEEIIQLIPPPAYGYGRTRESFKNVTGSVFDPLGAAEASASHTLSLLLNKERLTRILRAENGFGLNQYLDEVYNSLPQKTGANQQVGLMLEKLFTTQILYNLTDKKIDKQVFAIMHAYLENLRSKVWEPSQTEGNLKAHNAYLIHLLDSFKDHPEQFKSPPAPSLPPGSPIGCGHH